MVRWSRRESKSECTEKGQQIERMERIRDIVVELREKADASVPIDQVVEIAQEEGIDPEVTKRLIEQMKNEGILYEPRAGHVDKA